MILKIQLVIGETKVRDFLSFPRGAVCLAVKSNVCRKVTSFG